MTRRKTVKRENRHQAFLHQLAEPEETFCALQSSKFAVLDEGAFGVGDCSVDVGGRGEWDGGDDRSVVFGVAEAVCLCAGGGRDVFAVEVDLVFEVGGVEGC